MSESANNTTVTPVSSFLTDSAGKFWCIVPTSSSAAAQVCYDGTVDTATANVTLLLYNSHKVYHQNAGGLWYVFTSPGWAASTDPRIPVPPTTNESPDGTEVTTVGPAIYNTTAEKWTLATGSSGLSVAINDVTDASTSDVVLMVYKNHMVYQENSYGGWWSKAKSSDTWTLTSDPRGAAPPTTTPKITGVSLSSASFVAGAAVGTVVGTISVAMTGGTFNGSLLLSGINASSFQIVGSALQTKAVLSAGSFSINIVATQAGATGSPFTQSFSITATGSVTHYGTTAPATAPVGWTQVFFDDFTSLSVSTTAATVTTSAATYGTTMAWGTRTQMAGNTQTAYCDASMGSIMNPFTQSGSVVTINATVPTAAQAAILSKNGLGGRYVSGIIQTYPFLSVTYGYFECNMKIPPGNGMWTAFWMAPGAIKGGPVAGLYWPPEIDCFEQLGSDRYGMNSALHSGTANGVDNLKSGFGGKVPADMTTGFHTYGCLWTPTYVASYFDGKRVGMTTTGIGTTPYRIGSYPMYFMMQFQIGNGMGDPNATDNELPARMDIDWFRVYSLGPQ